MSDKNKARSVGPHRIHDLHSAINAESCNAAAGVAISACSSFVAGGRALSFAGGEAASAGPLGIGVALMLLSSLRQLALDLIEVEPKTPRRNAEEWDFSGTYPVKNSPGSDVVVIGKLLGGQQLPGLENGGWALRHTLCGVAV